MQQWLGPLSSYLGEKIANSPDQTWFSLADLLRSQNRAWQYCTKFHNTITSHYPCHHLSWLNWSCVLPNLWTKTDLSVMQLFLKTCTNRLLTKPSLFNSAMGALQMWKCFYMLHIAVSLYIFSFCFQSKSWSKDSRTKAEPLFHAGNPFGPSPILCHQVTLSSLSEFASISSLCISLKKHYMLCKQLICK